MIEFTAGSGTYELTIVIAKHENHAYVAIMRTPAIILGVITVILLWANLAISIKIMDYLKKYHKDVSLFSSGFFVRGRIFKYLPLYKLTTIEHDGKIGALYYPFYMSFILAMLALVTGLILVS